jgi:DNA-directed RNA polymerase specialized sigma24 family protein
MTDVPELAEAATSTDARVGLRAALALRKLAETLEGLQVQNARKQGWSWQEIADALEVSKQAVHKRYSGR